MNEYAKKMIQKDPMMYVNANGDRPLPKRLMPNEFEERGPYGRVRSIYPGTSFDGGMPGQGEQMPGVEEMVAKFRGGFMGQVGGRYRGMDEQQSADTAPMSTGLAERIGNVGEMDAAAKAQRELREPREQRQEAEDLRRGLEGLGEGLEGFGRGIQAARGENAPEARPGMKMPNMEMSGDESSKRASKFKEAYLAMLLGR